MALDRAHRDEQLRTDLGVAAVLSDQGQDLGLTSGDPAVAACFDTGPILHARVAVAGRATAT